MEQKTTSIWKSAMVYGLYIAIALILVSVIFYVTGNAFAKAGTYIGYLVMAIAIVFVQINYRKSLGGYMSYGQGLGIAVIAMVFAGVIVAIYTYLLFEVIDPGLKEQLRIFTEEQMMSRGLPEAQVEVASSMAAKFQKPAIMAIMVIVSYAFWGTLIGLITSIFTKKNAVVEE